MAWKKLPRSFYVQPTIKVARGLLGCFLVRRLRGKTIAGRIVEVEAYLGSADPASHAYKARTKRNDVMFRKGGHLYVYFTYGMHFCANVVTEEQGTGHAVLLRAVEPVEGVETMCRLRGKRFRAGDICLTNGPAKLCEAMGIGRKENGEDLLGSRIWIGSPTRPDGRFRVGTSTRVGISRGTEHPWRFFIRGNPYVSKGKPGPATRRK